MTSLMRAVFVAVLAILCVGQSQLAKAGWSPNGFAPPWCTWYADGRANETGWRLHFRQAGNAATWPWTVTNCTVWSLPWRNGSLMVFAGQPALGNPGNVDGHVAFVEQVWGVYPGNVFVVVTQTSWPSGQPVRWISGVPVYQAVFQVIGPGQARLVGSNKTLSVVYLLR